MRRASIVAIDRAGWPEYLGGRSQTLGHADLKTTSAYAYAKPNDSSSRYLKKT